jgi:hypothetical protein
MYQNHFFPLSVLSYSFLRLALFDSNIIQSRLLLQYIFDLLQKYTVDCYLSILCLRSRKITYFFQIVFFYYLVLCAAMNSNTTLVLFAVFAAMALVGATVTYIIVPADAALDSRYGQCKQSHPSDQACQNAKGR